jgi:ribonuclease HI
MDSASVIQGISNSCTMNNTSHITQMLKDKIEILDSRGKEIQFYLIPSHCGVEVNERADSEAKQSTKEGRDSQLRTSTSGRPSSPLEKERQRGASQFL